MKPDLSRYETDWPAHVVSAALESRDGQRSRRYPTERGDHPRRDDATTIHLVRRFGSTPSTVFNAWTDPALAGQWLFATASRPMARVRIDARVGGRFCLTEPRDTGTVEHHGQYVALDAPRRLAFTLSTPDLGGETWIGVDIEPRHRGCALTLVHAHVHPDEVARMRQRWTGILYGLGATLDPAPALPDRHLND